MRDTLTSYTALDFQPCYPQCSGAVCAHCRNRARSLLPQWGEVSVTRWAVLRPIGVNRIAEANSRHGCGHLGKVQPGRFTSFASAGVSEWTAGSMPDALTSNPGDLHGLAKALSQAPSSLPARRELDNPPSGRRIADGSSMHRHIDPLIQIYRSGMQQ